MVGMPVNRKTNPEPMAPPDRVEPVTLAQVVEQVFAQPQKATQGGKKGSKWRRVLPGRGKAEVADGASADKVESEGESKVDSGADVAGAFPDLLFDLLGRPGRKRLPRLALDPMVAPDNPAKCMGLLKRAREKQAKGSRAAAAALSQAQVMREIGLRAGVLQDLVESYPQRAEDLFRASEATSVMVQQAIDIAPARAKAAEQKAMAFYDEPLTQRVNAALALLASPSIRGAVPEASTLRHHASELAVLATALAEVAELVEDMDAQRERHDAVLSLMAGLPDKELWQRVLRREEERLRGGLANLKKLTKGLVFPERDDGAGFAMKALLDDPSSSSSSSVYAVCAVQMAEMDSENQAISVEVLDELHGLNVRVLLELAELTQRVEKGLGMAPLAAPRAAA